MPPASPSASGQVAVPQMTLDMFKGQFVTAALMDRVIAPVLDQQRLAAVSKSFLPGSKAGLQESLQATDQLIEQFQRYVTDPAVLDLA